MVVHVFGAYFGLAASWVLTTKAATKRSENSSDYRSDLFAMIGTLFLWIYWPSFTGSPAGAYSQERVIVNTLLALCGSALTGFCFSAWLRGENKFDMVDIQNATLAGGVAIGTGCDMYVTPGGALTIGAVAGAWSVFGYTKIQGFLEEHLGVYDTCGVNNLHGMPGIIAGIAGFFLTWGADHDDYGGDCELSQVFGGRYSDASDCCTSGATCDLTRTAAHQAGVQIGYLAMTMINAIIAGLIGGYLVKWIEPIRKDGAKSFQDDENWEVPSFETPYYFDPRGTIRKIMRTGAEEGVEDDSSVQHAPLRNIGEEGVPEFVDQDVNSEPVNAAAAPDIAGKLDKVYKMLMESRSTNVSTPP